MKPPSPNPGKIYVPGLRAEDFISEDEIAEGGWIEEPPPKRYFPGLKGANGFKFPEDIAESLHNYAFDAARLFQLDATAFPPEFAKQVDAMDDDRQREWFSRIYQHCLQIMRDGFVIALTRYADDLKSSAEASRMLKAIRRNAAKGGAVVKKKAESKRQQAIRLDRELRKTMKKKYLRVQRIAAEMRVDPRTVERYLAPLK